MFILERVADYIIDRLVREHVGTVFLVTGRGILYLTDAVVKNPNIKGISMYHEQGASYAAMAYASARDGLGACLVSTGCAAANAVAAALCAWQDNIPCIFISGQHMLRETTRYTGLPLRTYGSQEADIISIVKPVTKYAAMLTDAKDVAVEMDKAIYAANEGRKGPVWIDVPLDIQNARIEPETLRRCDHQGVAPAESATEEDIRRTVAELESAERPLLFVGGGVRSAGACELVRDFAQINGIPVVFSTSAADAVGSENSFSIGVVGSLGGSRAGNFAVQNADYLLVLGSKLCSQTIGSNADRFARGAKITVVDIDRLEHQKQGAHIDRLVTADVKQFMKHLSAAVPKLCYAQWLEKCRHWKETFSISKEAFLLDRRERRIDLYHFADALSGMLPNDAVVITDAGFEELIVPSTVRFKDGQRCLFPAAQGAMGYAIPAIAGAYFAGKRHIVTVVGDGSVMMNIQELQVISWHKIPAKIFVINNNMYAVIRKRQKDLFRTRTIGNDPSDGVPTPDLRKIADSFGFQYVCIEDDGELAAGLDEVFGVDLPCICEVLCKEEQPYLHESFVLNQAHRLIKRPIEDLAPFLSREKFLTEMLIDPIEE